MKGESLSGVSPAPDTEWATIGENWHACMKAWLENPNETTVREKLMVPLLEALGWATQEWHAEVHCKIPVGQKEHSAMADYVLAPLTCVQNTGGKNYWNGGYPWAVIEMKRPLSGTGAVDAAQRQARSYADHIRVPVYAVVDGDSIHIWHRRLVQEDERVAAIRLDKASDLLDRRTELEKHLGAGYLKQRRETLMSVPSNVEASEVASDPRDKQSRDIYLEYNLQDDVLRTALTLDDLVNANTWWGSPEQTDPAAYRPVRLGISGDLGDDPGRSAPAMLALVCRLLIHGRVQNLFVDKPDGWRRALSRYPLLAGDAQLLQDRCRRVCLLAGNLSRPPNPSAFDLVEKALTVPLSSSLDDWTVAAVRSKIGDILNVDAPIDRTPARWQHASVVSQLAAVWKASGRASLTATLLQSMVQNGQLKNHPQQARTRLGPQHVDRIVDCILFSLAITEHVTGLSLVPEGEYEANLRLGTGKPVGFAYSLPELHSGEDSLGRMGDFAKNARILIFTALPYAATSLASAHAIGRLRGGPPVIGDQLEPMLFSLTGEAGSAMAQGWKEFMKHLDEASPSRWISSRRTEVEKGDQ